LSANSSAEVVGRVELCDQLKKVEAREPKEELEVHFSYPPFQHCILTMQKENKLIAIVPVWTEDIHIPPPATQGPSNPNTIDCLNPPAWKQLANHTLTMHEHISLVTAIFSDHNEVQMVRSLCGEDAQTFVDMITEVGLHTLHLRMTG
jgi:hypothetical protein